MRLRPRLPQGFGAGQATPRDAQRAYKAAIKRAGARTRHSEGAAEPVQLVGQAVRGDDYRRLHAHWARKASGWGTGRWPERLAGDELALFLVPVKLGTTLKGTSGWLRPAWMPGFGTFEITLGAATALATTAAVWLDTVAPDLFPAGLVLAPPVLESYATGRLLQLTVEDFGLKYELPALL